MKNMPVRWLALIAAALFVAACAGQKAPAEKAVADIEATLSSIRDDASKYAPAELQQAEAGLASLRDSLAKKDYKAVVAAAPALSAQLTTLQQTVTAKRDEAQAAMAAASEQWKSFSTQVPDMVAAIQSRVDILSQAKKLPKTLTADTFQAAKDGLEAAKSSWAQATSQFGSGDPVGAVAKAQEAKAKADEVLKLLGMG
ncbi:MAG TPA: hypothetical protein VKB34_19605 [Povalibacter sp.]|nr:hypothetical protein [Povalibacter sp.]